MDHSGSRTGAVRAYHGLIGLALLLPLLALILGSWFAWNATLRDARVGLARALAAASDHAAKVLDTQVLIAGRVNDMLSGMDRDAVAAHAVALRNEIRTMLRRFPQIAAVTVTGAAGHALLSTSDHPVDGNAAGAWLQALRDPRAPFVIGSIAVDRLTGQTGIVVGTRWGGDAQHPSGLVLAIAAADFAAAEHVLAGGGNDIGASLTLGDGTELARYPAGPIAGQAAAQDPALRQAMLADPAGGIMRARWPAGGSEALVAYARLPEYPVYVSVARRWSSIVAQWRGVVASHLIFGVPATIALVVLCMALARRAERDGAATAALQAERQQRETAEEALRQAQKMESVGRLTAGIAHDFNNHLTVISSNIELLKRRMPPEAQPLAPLMDGAMQGVRRAAALTHRLLAFARQQPADPEPLDMARLIDGMAALLRTALGDTVVVEIHGSNGLWQTRVDAGQMEGAILHLAVNARDAMPAGGALAIDVANVQLDAAYAAAHAEASEGDHVMVAFADTGVGMSPEVAARACEPFFTTKPPGKGVGVGLSMVHGLVRQTGGHMTIASGKGRGTTVTLYLPRYVHEHAGVVAPAPKAAASAGGNSGETVLVVEDDDAVRRSAAQALHEIGYEVLEAPDAMEAIRLIADRGGIDLLFTDVGLPGGVDGRALAAAARTASPAIRVLFTTGFARYAAADGCGSGVDFLAKPFTLEELGAKVREVLDGAAPADVVPVSG